MTPHPIFSQSPSTKIPGYGCSSYKACIISSTSGAQHQRTLPRPFKATSSATILCLYYAHASRLASVAKYAASLAGGKSLTLSYMMSTIHYSSSWGN